MNRIALMMLSCLLIGTMCWATDAETPVEEVKLSTFGQQGARSSSNMLANIKLTPGKNGGFFRSKCGVKVADTAQFELEFQSSVSGTLQLKGTLVKDAKKSNVSLVPIACTGDGTFHKIIFELTEIPIWKTQEYLEDLELRFVPDDAKAEATIGFQHAKFTNNAPKSPAEKAQAALRESGRMPIKLHSFGNIGTRVKGYTVKCKLQPGKAGGAFRPNDQLAVGNITQLTLNFKSSIPGTLRLSAGLVLKDGKNVSAALPNQSVTGNNTQETLFFELTELPNYATAHSFKEIELRFTPKSPESAEIEFSNAAFTTAVKKN